MMTKKCVTHSCSLKSNCAKYNAPEPSDWQDNVRYIPKVNGKCGFFEPQNNENHVKHNQGK